LDLNALGCDANGKSKSTNTPEPCSPSTGPTCDGTKTCGRFLRKASGASISSAADSPAKTSALPERDPASPVLGLVFGTSSLGSLASYDHATSSWRTSQRSLLEEWEPFSETFPRSGMTRSGTLFQLQPLVRRTGGNGSGSLPFGTPTANEKLATAYPTPNMGERFRRRHGGNLLESVANVIYPTPSASQMPCEGTVRLARQRWLDGDCTLEEANAIAGRDVRDKQGKVPAMWQTPTTKANQGAPSMMARGVACRNLRDATAGGALNPTWVEWLMGFPLGWTDCADSATPSSPKSPK